jgi:hypothetical protein
MHLEPRLSVRVEDIHPNIDCVSDGSHTWSLSVDKMDPYDIEKHSRRSRQMRLELQES